MKQILIVKWAAAFFALFTQVQLSHAASTENLNKTYKVNWILAHEPIRAFERAARNFANEVGRRTNGKVIINIVDGKTYNGGKAMSASQAFSLVQSGKVEMTQTYTTHLGNYSPSFWALDLPFLFKDHEQAARALEGAPGQQIMASLDKTNVHGLSFTYSGGYMILPTAKREIKTIEDFKGLKVKINNDSPVGTALMKTLGAVPVPTQDPGAQGLDGLETTYARFVELDASVKADKAIINDLQHSMFLTAILVNKPFFDALPVSYQKAFAESAVAAARMERADSVKDCAKIKEDYIKDGHKVVAMTAVENARFKNSVGPVYAKFEPIFGKDLVASLRNN
jgi:TRAP-type C4-dicarboxylate transport system substrate-binding protein